MNIHEKKKLSDILYYHIGGAARYILEVKSRDDVLAAFDFIKKNNIEKFLVVGLGSNLLMQDDNFDGAIIWLTKSELKDITLTSDGLIRIYAGQTLDDLILFSFANNLVGLESLAGLPSTIGGAIHGNAGAFGTEMKDILEKAEVFDQHESKVKELTNKACLFAYRDSLFKHNHNLVILRGYFRLRPATDEEVTEAKKVYQEKIDYRSTNHPVEYPSCGSVFKNIRKADEVKKILAVWPDMREQVEAKWHGKVSMGYVIKRLGFSGIQVGGAKITDKHANYISNINNAKASDVLAIIERIKHKFHDTLGFYPELEAEVVK